MSTTRLTRKPFTLLLIEDDDNDVFFFRRVLSFLEVPVTVRVVSTAWEARDYMEGRKPFNDRNYSPVPDLIVADMHLPGVSGTEFLRWLREKPEFNYILFFVLSGSMAAEKIAEVLSLGAAAHYVKTPNFDLAKANAAAMLAALPP